MTQLTKETLQRIGDHLLRGLGGEVRHFYSLPGLCLSGNAVQTSDHMVAFNVSACDMGDDEAGFRGRKDVQPFIVNHLDKRLTRYLAGIPVTVTP